MSGFTLTLPIPPSANNLFKTVGNRRPPTGQYLDWRDAAGWNLKQSKVERVSGRYGLFLLLPIKMRGDVSNRLKAVEDLLVANNLTDDDSRSDIALAARWPGVVEGTCIVIARPIAAISPAALNSVVGGPTPLPVLPQVGAEAA